jgi:hypothetical protein
VEVPFVARLNTVFVHGNCRSAEHCTPYWRAVTVAKEVGTSIEIEGGLQEGEMVVVDGQNNLSDSVSVVIRKR